MKKPVRCVNIDWLEVHCYEPLLGTLNAAYFRRNGYNVEEREYGTRVYREMFTILDDHGYGLIEVRRNPASQGTLGIHSENECHIRLCNRTCYFDNAADLLQLFLSKHQYYNVRISRVDICLDFSTFDKGDDPTAFVRRYFRHKYAKINQGRISSHGADTWSGQEWNSLSWGAKSSPVYTKLYDKTLELYNPKFNTFGKPYIRQAWLLSGLIDDLDRCTLNGEQVKVWRVEFSLTSAVKNWVRIELDGKAENYQSLRNDLSVYSNRERILLMFMSLARHYFRFKYYEEGKRKDRCPDKILFDWQQSECVYKIGRNDYALRPDSKNINQWAKLLGMLEEYRNVTGNYDTHKAATVVVNAIKDDILTAQQADRFSKEETIFLRRLINIRLAHPEFTYDAAVDLVRDFLNIKDRTLPKSEYNKQEKAVQ